MADTHVRTPYRCSRRDFKGKGHPHHWYITGDPSADVGIEVEEDGSESPALYEESCVGVAVVLGNETAGDIPQKTAEFLCRAANAHVGLLAACEAFVQAAKDAHEHWDADRDMKVGKLLAAMAGYLKNYRADLTAAHAALLHAGGQPCG